MVFDRGVGWFERFGSLVVVFLVRRSCRVVFFMVRRDLGRGIFWLNIGWFRFCCGLLVLVLLSFDHATRVKFRPCLVSFI